MDGSVGQRQLSSHHDDEVQVTDTHVCARDPADCMVSHPRPDLERAKAPTWRANCRSFEQTPTSKFILLRVRLGWCTKGHKVYTSLGRMSLRPVHCCSCYQYRKRFVVGGTNGRERDGSQVSGGKVERTPRAWLLLGCVLCVQNDPSP